MVTIGKVNLGRVTGADLWRVLSAFTVQLDDGRRVVVPHGFLTDKASTPLGIIIKRDDKYIIEGALVHDYLYQTQKISGQPITRKEADGILVAICKHAGMGWIKRTMVYAGVRAGGWNTWGKYES